jgi:hypothetical protein
VLDRIEVNVIKVPGEMVRVAQGVLPMAPRLYPALAFDGAAGNLFGMARETVLLISRRRGAKSLLTPVQSGLRVLYQRS